MVDRVVVLPTPLLLVGEVLEVQLQRLLLQMVLEVYMVVEAAALQQLLEVQTLVVEEVVYVEVLVVVLEDLVQLQHVPTVMVELAAAQVTVRLLLEVWPGVLEVLRVLQVLQVRTVLGTAAVADQVEERVTPQVLLLVVQEDHKAEAAEAAAHLHTLLLQSVALGVLEGLVKSVSLLFVVQAPT